MIVLALLQQTPIIIEVGKPPEATPDISIDFVVGMFAMAGIFLLAALIGSVLVAGAMVLYKRRQDRSASSNETSHTTLRI
jgi:hypothetical protein